MSVAPHDFFISRAGADAACATAIADRLRKAGYAVYLQDDFVVGRSFVDHMNEGVEIGHVIALFSPEYLVSPYTTDEWQAIYARYGRDRIIPVLLRQCEVPAVLSQVIRLEVIGKNHDAVSEAVVKAVGGPRPRNTAQFSVAKLPTVNPLLVGREKELKQLDSAWTDPAVRLVSIVAYGGVGKTSLAINWWHRNTASGAQHVLGWSFYSQGAAEDRQASADPFLDHALRQWFGLENAPQDSWQRGEKLAELLREERTLLILDGLESIQFPPGPQHGRLQDPGMVALLKELAAHSPGLCVCTSRLPLTDLEDYGNAGALTIDLDNLSPESGAKYLKQLGVQGPDTELREASEEFGNHALALTLLGTLLVKRRGGDIRKRDTIPSLFSDPKKGGHARRVYRQYEVLFKGKPELDVLRILGLFDRPADPGALHILRKLQGDQWAEALENLKDARLVEYTDSEGTLDGHPLLREHFAEEYRASNPDAFREAHSQLYEHYSKQAPYQPDTLEAMAPLFYAVYHGCQARRYQEACDDLYRDRILRGTVEFFLYNHLGAFGVNLSLLGNFFATPWSQPAPGLYATTGRWVINSAGYALRALGRLAEAVEPTWAGGVADIAAKDWKNAAISLRNLGQLQLALGDLLAAAAAARQAVDFADRSGDEFEPMGERSILADILHQSGELEEAKRLFQEAESMQAKSQPDHPFLSSLQGHRYCDLLLTQGQTAQVLLRATQTLKLARQYHWPLSIALDRLSVGRAHSPGSDEATQQLEEAVRALRKAGQLDNLPLGLLARASNSRHIHNFLRAQQDLDEVRILATRCGMRLHLTDYHLEQGRLYLAQSQPYQARPHYEAAQKLINETGYRRRDLELAELASKL